jgi:hypothetical protein
VSYVETAKIEIAAAASGSASEARMPVRPKFSGPTTARARQPASTVACGGAAAARADDRQLLARARGREELAADRQLRRRGVGCEPADRELGVERRDADGRALAGAHSAFSPIARRTGLIASSAAAT